MDDGYTRMTWDQREALRRKYEAQIDDARSRRRMVVSDAELMNRGAMEELGRIEARRIVARHVKDAAPVEDLEEARATEEGMPEPLTFEDTVHRQGRGRPAKSVKVSAGVTFGEGR